MGKDLPFTAFKHASGTLYVFSGPNRLIQIAHAEPSDQSDRAEVVLAYQ